MEFIPFLGLKKRKFKKRIHNGMLLLTDPSEHIQQQIFWYGFYERKYVLTWERLLNDDWIVLDIGANIGYYSLIAAGIVKKGHIYAFEPDARSIFQIRENLSLNHIKNADVVAAAVSDQDTGASFYAAGPENIGMSGLTQPENFTGTGVMVRTIRLDTWVVENQIKKVDCIKMDIEGAEYKALTGMKQLLQQFRPVLFIEISAALLERNGNTTSQIYELLDSYGYASFKVIKENELGRLNTIIEDELVVFRPVETL